MTEEIKRTILIPDEVEYTKALFVQIEPPHSMMSISFTKKGEKEPFRVGKVISRRCQEIAAYMFRPNKLNLFTKKRDAPLVAGDTIIVKVVMYSECNTTKQTLSKSFQEVTKEIKVT